jgi:hypothetical protein
MRLSERLLMAAAGNQGVEPPQYIGHGGLATTSGSPLTVNPPTCEAGDLLLMFVNERPEQPSGWSTVIAVSDGEPVSSNYFGKVFSKVASSSESAVNVTVSNAGDDCQRGIMIAIRGWSGIADSEYLISLSTNTYTLPEVDTLYPNSLIIYALNNLVDTNTGLFSAISNGTLTDLAIRANLWSNFSDGGGWGIATGTKETIGSSGSGTATVASSATGVMFAISISP